MSIKGKGRLQVDDYYIQLIEVNKYPKIQVEIDDLTRKETLRLKEEHEPISLTIHALMDKNAQIVRSATQYLYYLKKNQNKKDTSPQAKALLHYFRFIDLCGCTFDVFPEREEDRPTYRYADYLIGAIADSDDNISLSTAKNRMRTVLAFYRYLIYERMIDPENINKAFVQEEVEIRNTRSRDSNMLSHISARSSRGYTKIVHTTDIMASFPSSQYRASHDTLKPMTPKHKALFYNMLSELKVEKQLMFRLAIECGLRLEEFVTVPLRIVRRPKFEDVIKVVISPIKDNWETKNSKEGGVIEISSELMWDLYDYTLSERFINRKGNSDRLFINRDGKLFAKNTIETAWSAFRRKIRKIDSSWYYRIHDLRSTFATYKFEELVEIYGVITAGTLLQSLMRQQDFSSTLKYIKFFEVNSVKKEHGRMLNQICEDSIAGNDDGKEYS
ncbi:site-specific integrase [Vibrio parahaemolyticus]|nr:site-specific integrase [Vibrio parahaemolyticus]MBM5019223.1 site-specific integrase [Vibrio parahaemolyticus]